MIKLLQNLLSHHLLFVPLRMVADSWMSDAWLWGVVAHLALQMQQNIDILSCEVRYCVKVTETILLKLVNDYVLLANNFLYQ